MNLSSSKLHLFDNIYKDILYIYLFLYSLVIEFRNIFLHKLVIILKKQFEAMIFCIYFINIMYKLSKMLKSLLNLILKYDS